MPGGSIRPEARHTQWDPSPSSVFFTKIYKGISMEKFLKKLAKLTSHLYNMVHGMTEIRMIFLLSLTVYARKE